MRLSFQGGLEITKRSARATRRDRINTSVPLVALAGLFVDNSPQFKNAVPLGRAGDCQRLLRVSFGQTKRVSTACVTEPGSREDGY
jgi:hypothetical protein